MTTKTKFKNLFTDQLRNIALEETEFVKVDENDAASILRLTSKAEALARMLWREALGYKTTKVLADDSVKVTEHLPNHWAIGVLLDRVEGKATPTVTSIGEKAHIADRVREQSSKFINKAADDSKS